MLTCVHRELGYKRDDPSTWDRDFLPSSSKGGLYNLYGAFWYDLLHPIGASRPMSRVAFGGLSLILA